MAVSKQYKVKVDLKRNLLRITLTGIVDKKEIEGLYTDIRFGVADLSPGFTVINDLSQCRIGYLCGLSTFAKIREHLQVNKVGKVIRVVGKQGLVPEQLSRIVDKKTKYEIVYVDDLDAAEMHLPTDVEAVG